MLYSSALVTRKTKKSPWHIHTSTYQLATHCFTLSRYPILIDLNALLPTLSSIFRSFPPHVDIMHNKMGLWYTMNWCCCCGFHTSAAHQNKHTYKHRIQYLFTLFCFSVIPLRVIHLYPLKIFFHFSQRNVIAQIPLLYTTTSMDITLTWGEKSLPFWAWLQATTAPIVYRQLIVFQFARHVGR